MTELDKYELKPGGYYAIKLSDDWTFKAFGNYRANVFSDNKNSPIIIPLFKGMELVQIIEVEND